MYPHGSRYIWGSCLQTYLKPGFWVLKVSFASFRGRKSSQKLSRIFRERGFSFRGAILLYTPFKSPLGGFGGCSILQWSLPIAAPCRIGASWTRLSNSKPVHGVCSGVASKGLRMCWDMLRCVGYWFVPRSSNSWTGTAAFVLLHLLDFCSKVPLLFLSLC